MGRQRGALKVEPAQELGRDVLCVGSAAAIAEQEHLAAALVRVDQHLSHSQARPWVSQQGLLGSDARLDLLAEASFQVGALVGHLRGLDFLLGLGQFDAAGLDCRAILVRHVDLAVTIELYAHGRPGRADDLADLLTETVDHLPAGLDFLGHNHVLLPSCQLLVNGLGDLVVIGDLNAVLTRRGHDLLARRSSFFDWLSKSVWFQRDIAFRMCDSSFIGRCSPPFEST